MVHRVSKLKCSSGADHERFEGDWLGGKREWATRQSARIGDKWVGRTQLLLGMLDQIFARQIRNCFPQ